MEPGAGTVVHDVTPRMLPPQSKDGNHLPWRCGGLPSAWREH